MSYRQLWQRLTKQYDADEAKAIVRMVFDILFGWSLADLYTDKFSNLTQVQSAQVEAVMRRLEAGEPVQYILGEAEFGNRRFKVTPDVLIPRPETNELVEWVTQTAVAISSHPHILDIGTGSGCIAITLALNLLLEVYKTVSNGLLKEDTQKEAYKIEAWDVSPAALHVAKENAERHNADVVFERHDILSDITPNDSFDIIVSNPPYICEKERAEMEPHVLDYEPALALFVPDNDPLRFYRAIAEFGQKWLKADGLLFFEINPHYHDALCDMLTQTGYSSIETKNDIYGKQRMIKARKL